MTERTRKGRNKSEARGAPGDKSLGGDGLRKEVPVRKYLRGSGSIYPAVVLRAE